MSVVTLDRILVKRPEWPVAVQLARREGRRMLRHPVMWVGALLSLALFGLFTWHSAPVLHRDDANAAGSLLPLALSTLIVANLAASRAARNATDELYDATSSPPRVRTLGHLVSLSYAVAAAMGLIGVMFVYMVLDSPVGTAKAAELAVGPMVVVLFGAIGIAVARWRSHPALGPMAVVVAIGLQILLIQPVVDIQSTNSTVVTRTQWLAPWVPLSLTGEVPPELVIRPAGWHVLYLVGMAAVVAAFALSRKGARARLLPLFIVGAAGIALGLVGQFTPASAAQRTELGSLLAHPEDHQICEERRDVTYCAYPAYAPWIDRWAAPIEGALDRIPPEARPQDLVVRQRLGAYFEGPIDVPEDVLRQVVRGQRRASPLRAPETTIWTGVRWGRGSTEGGYAIGLSLAVAMQALDLPSSRAEMVLGHDEIGRLQQSILPMVDDRFRARAQRALQRRRSRWYACNTSHQARAVAAIWIAAQATPATRATVTRAAAETPYGLYIYEANGKRMATYNPFFPLYPQIPPPMWDRVIFGDVEYHYAARLLGKPDDEVAALIAERWDEIVEPTTTTDAFLDDLGLAPHMSIEEQIATLPDDVELERGRRNWSPDAYLVGTVPCF